MKQENFITEQEYDEVKKRLTEIQIEKENAKKVYLKYFSSEEIFSSDELMNLIIILKRRNNELENIITFKKKKYLNFYNNNNQQYINDLISWLNGDQSKIPNLEKNEYFSLFQEEITNLKDEKLANNILIEAIESLLKEEEELLNKEKIFKKTQKKQKKRLLFKKKDAKMN